MAQDRMLRASMRSSEKVNSWPIPLRYFWTQLWGYCDDHGRGRYDPRLIVADTFPMDDEVDTNTVSRWMQALTMAGVIASYEVDGKKYFECVNWSEHQEPPYLKRTEIPDRSGVVPIPGKRSGKVQKDSEKSRPIEGEVEVEEKGKGKAPNPSPFCEKHPQGTDAPCRRCGDARKQFEANATAAKNRPTVPGIVTAADCDRHPGRPARGCDRCAEEAVAS
ncbi:hypothetical protein ABIB56_000812 [Glaciihabitans sp. UYNi722]